MEIKFNISDSETDIIAEQYAYDGSTDKNDFVLEQFKKFGRDCIASQAMQTASINAEATKNAEVESAKSAISF